uniref:Caspase domain-containing protein n=1 Tax=Desulfovibrio sp. U5L TaxID=596152 RepID=I2PZ32_9BACT
MTTKALLVGVNVYKNCDCLKGCINDVTNIRDILKTYCLINNNDIRVLVDDRATKNNIMSRLKTMIDNAKEGDFLLFHFSGHGSQIRDRDGDDLEDGLDELICPHDMDWDGTYITDDMLKEMFAPLSGKKVFLEVLLDCCHSGTGTRKFGLIPPPDLAPQQVITSRYLTPPTDIICRAEGEDLRQNQFIEGIPENQVCWAGCKDYQTSADAQIDCEYNGAFTYYLCKHIRDANGLLTREGLRQRLCKSLDFNRFAQTPQLECCNFLRSEKPFFMK